MFSSGLFAYICVAKLKCNYMIIVVGELSEKGKIVAKTLENSVCPDHPNGKIVIEEKGYQIRFFYCGCDKIRNIMKAKLRSIGMDDVLN